MTKSSNDSPGGNTAVAALLRAVRDWWFEPESGAGIRMAEIVNVTEVWSRHGGSGPGAANDPSYDSAA